MLEGGDMMFSFTIHGKPSDEWHDVTSGISRDSYFNLLDSITGLCSYPEHCVDEPDGDNEEWEW